MGKLETHFIVYEEDELSGLTHTLGLKLNKEPASDVLITLNRTSYPSNELRVNIGNQEQGTDSLLFTKDDWWKIQTLEISGYDNDVEEDISKYILNFNLTSNDHYLMNYDSAPIKKSIMMVIDSKGELVIMRNLRIATLKGSDTTDGALNNELKIAEARPLML